jgi:hypothetical protein
MRPSFLSGRSLPLLLIAYAMLIASGHAQTKQNRKESQMSRITATQPGSAEAVAIRPFRVNFPEAELTELRRRIKATKWPNKELVSDATPGSLQGIYLITSDLEATRAELVARGVQVSEPFHFGPEGQTPGLDPGRASYSSFVSFSDPDGNGWLIQEIKQRAPGR